MIKNKIKTFLKSLYKSAANIFEKISKEKNPFETIIGILVIIIAVVFLTFALSQIDSKTVKGYDLTITFPQVAGLSSGADVKLNGIKIGSILKQELDINNYEVKLYVRIKKDIKIPKDSKASVVSNGLLGDKYVKIDVGTSQEYFNGNDVFKGTNYKTLENLIGDYIFSTTKEDNK